MGSIPTCTAVSLPAAVDKLVKSPAFQAGYSAGSKPVGSTANRTMNIQDDMVAARLLGHPEAPVGQLEEPSNLSLDGSGFESRSGYRYKQTLPPVHRPVVQR